MFEKVIHAFDFTAPGLRDHPFQQQLRSLPTPYALSHALSSDAAWRTFTADLEARLRTALAQDPPISAYNRRYLEDYLRRFDYFMGSYRQLLGAAVSSLDKPWEETTLVDYGGGCGLLSYLVRLSGVGRVVYNDLYEVSVHDVGVLGRLMDLEPHLRISGGIDAVLACLSLDDHAVPLWLSYDVMEHIYDPWDWFRQLRDQPGPFQVWALSHANEANPVRARGLRRLHHRAEHVGFPAEAGWKADDLARPFIEVRREWIAEHAPELSPQEHNWMATHSRGLYGKGLFEAVDRYRRHGSWDHPLPGATNTCDPRSGNWTEHLIDMDAFCDYLEELGYRTDLKAVRYSYSGSGPKDNLKKALNRMMARFPRWARHLAPAYLLSARFPRH